jgi:hypothetical protein
MGRICSTNGKIRNSKNDVRKKTEALMAGGQWNGGGGKNVPSEVLKTAE